jgi:hypothetical protein
MTTNKLIISTLAFFVLFCITNLIWYTYFFPFQDTAAREERLMTAVLPGALIASFMFSYLYGQLAKGGNKVREGFKQGSTLGTFMYLPLFLIFYGTRDTMPLAAWLMNAAFHIIQFGIFGIMVAHIRGKGASAEAKRTKQMPA